MNETRSTQAETIRVRGADPSTGFAPTGPSGEHDFLAERLSFFGRIACLASAGFLVMRLVLNAFSVQRERFPFFHLAATAVLLLVWFLAGSRLLSDRGLRRLDGAGTIGAALAYAMMESTMPLAWRPDQLVLLILNAVLLGRAALVPSEPRRTARISVVAVAAIPAVTFFLYRGAASRDLPVGAVVSVSSARSR